METDAGLLASWVRARDEAAFAELSRRHAAMVYRVCLRILGDAHEAEDAAQATFVVLVRKAGGIRRGESLAAWLHGAARQVAGEALRARSRRARREEAAGMLQAASRGEGAAPEAERREALALLDREVAALPEAQRQAVILRYLEGLSQAQAAEAMGCPQGTLGRRASEGLERLRQRLCQRGCVLGVAALVGLLEAEAQAAVSGALLPFILAVPKLAAAGAAAGTAGSTVVSLAEGAMKAMFWAKMKLVASVVAAAAVVSTAVPVTYHAVRAAEPSKKPEPVAEAPTEKPAEKPAAVEAGKVAWGEAVDGLQAGLIPLGGGAARDWPHALICPNSTCGIDRKTIPGTGKCQACAGPTGSSSCRYCSSCAATRRLCQYCGAARPWGATFGEGEPLVFDIHLQNVGDRQLQLQPSRNHADACTLSFQLQGGVAWQFVSYRLNAPGTPLDPYTLGAGKTLAVTWSSAKRTQPWAGGGFVPRAEPSRAPVDNLPPGKYTVTASYEHAEHRGGDCPYWHGKVATGAVEIEIKPKGAAAQSEAGEAKNTAKAESQVDPEKLAKAKVVLRVRWKEISPPGGNPSDTVEVLKVIKNESGREWGPTALIDYEPGKGGIPRNGECTVYLEKFDSSMTKEGGLPRLKGDPWALLGGGAETGISHVSR